MSSKFLHSVTDENPDLRKHIGCMNGFFQLFDRHHFVSRRRIGGGQDPKRLSAPGQSINHGMRPNSTTNGTKERSLKEEVKEKHKVSVESSRTSFSSSSCSSTFSSVEYNRTARPEASSCCQSISPEATPSLTSTLKQSNPSSHSGQQSFNLRDVVKDSIYREPRRLPIKTIAKKEGPNQVVKYMDSPRPLQLCRPDKAKFCGPSETIRALDRKRNTAWNSNEERYAPRLSYDGRESRDMLRSNINLKELPRLSLDSRTGSVRSSAAESRSNYLLGDMQQVKQYSNEPDSNKRPSSVVARLMGLEAFPDPMSKNDDQMKDIKSYPGEHFDTISRLSRVADKSRKSQVSGSPRLSQGDPDSPQLRNINSIMKQKTSSRFPVEAAPWRQPQNGPGFKKQASRHGEAPNSCSSVYGEIEKRLTELEFKKSGKDLRALKQILEAMEKTRKRLESRKEGHSSNFESQASSYSQNYSSCLDQRSKLTTQPGEGSNLPMSPTMKGRIPPKRLESPIVIIKPAKFIDNSRNSGSSSNPTHRISSLKLRTSDSADRGREWNYKQTAADLILGKNHLTDPSNRSLHSMSKSITVRTPRSTQTSKVDQPMMRQNLTRPGKSSGTTSPRLQQMKHEMEKRARPTTTSYDSNKTRQQNSKQPMELGSAGRKLKPKSPRHRHVDDRLSEISGETGNLSPQGDAASVQSESNISSISQTETEVTSSDCSNQINGRCPQDQKDKNLAARLSKDKSVAELTTANLEQPSPVSVLDATFYKEDPPSPLKKTSNAFKDNETLRSSEADDYRVDGDHLLNSTRAKLNCGFDDHKSTEDVKQLVCKLKRLDFADARSTMARIASLQENTGQDHIYIAEILSASGFLLKDLSFGQGNIQLHASGYLINPNLYFALEQTKASTGLPNDEHNNGMSTGSKSKEQTRRKLIFDTVSQILALKLASPVSSDALFSPNKLGGRSWSGQKLLEEVCSVIDGLQEKKDSSLDNEDDWLISILTEDVMHQPDDWADYGGEVAGRVLDIERLIFKDLITEIVSKQ